MKHLPKLLFFAIFSFFQSVCNAQGAYYVYQGGTIDEGWMYNFVYTGTPQGTAGPGGGVTVDPTASGSLLNILDRTASPEGGNFIATDLLSAQQQFALGIPATFQTGYSTYGGAAGTWGYDPTGFNGGELYLYANFTFWMRANEMDYNGQRLGYMFDQATYNVYDGSGNLLAAGYQGYGDPPGAPPGQGAAATFDSRIWNQTGWNAIQPGFASNVDYPGTYTTFSFTRAATDWDYANNVAVAAVLPDNLAGGIGVDFVRLAAVPEPSGAMLLGLAGTLLTLRRRRTCLSTGRVLPRVSSVL